MNSFGLDTIKKIYMKVLVDGNYFKFKKEITLDEYYKIYYVELGLNEQWYIPLGYLKSED